MPATNRRATSTRRRAARALTNESIVGTGFVVILVAIGACSSRESQTKDGSVGVAPHQGQSWFDEVAKESGVNFVHVSGLTKRYWFPEIMSGGACLFDFDGDGYVDLYLVQGGDLSPSAENKPGNKLYRNLRDGTFEEVTDSAGVGDTGYGVGCSCGDYDADGDVDLYVTNVGANVLYRNNGNGTFTNVTDTAQVGDPGWGSSSAFVDYDCDGYLDLFVVNYIHWSIGATLKCFSPAGEREYCAPNSFDAPAPDTLYHNNGDGTYTDVSEEAGIRNAFGNGLGVVCGDFNSDGLVDIYVANDGLPNQLWINSGHGRFTDEALISGCAVNIRGQAEAGMGVATVDIDADGDLDLFMSHLRGESNTFYSNANGWFDDTTANMGLGKPSWTYTGFGLGFADFNHDRQLDVFVVNGAVTRLDRPFDPSDFYAEPNLVFMGQKGPLFKEVLPRGGTNPPLIATSRGAAFGDLENDGDIDIIVVNRDAPVHILRNHSGADGNWIMFRVLNSRGGIGVNASLRLEADGRTQFRMVQRAYSYCSSNDPRVHFGLASSTRVDQVTVDWPDGDQESFGPFPVGRIHVLRQGEGQRQEVSQDM